MKQANKNRAKRNRRRHIVFKEIFALITWWLIITIFISVVWDILLLGWFLPIVAIACIVLLRQIVRIPYIGEGWQDLFGDEKRLWDWMDLLLAPGLIAFAGIYLADAVSVSSADRAILESRDKKLMNYLTFMTELRATFPDELKGPTGDETRKINNELIKSLEEGQYLEFYKRGVDKKERETYKNLKCNPSDGDGRKFARAIVLMSLKSLRQKRSVEKLFPDQGRIIEHLHQTGLINRNNPLISLQKVDLSVSDLAEAYLPDSCLHSIDVSQSSLSGADLKRSALNEVNFKNANLSKANLSQADLRGASFQGANLRQAILDGTFHNRFHYSADKSTNYEPFKGADISGASFLNADMHEEVFKGARYNSRKITRKKASPIHIMACQWKKTLARFVRPKVLDICSDIESTSSLNIEPTKFPKSVQPSGSLVDVCEKQEVFVCEDPAGSSG